MKKTVTLPCDVGDLLYLHDVLLIGEKPDFVWELEVKSVTYSRETNTWHIVAETTKQYYGSWRPFEFDYSRGRFYNIKSWGGTHPMSSILRKTTLKIHGINAQRKELEEQRRKLSNGEFD